MGRPPTFKSAKELQARIDSYFKSGVAKRKIFVGSGKSRRAEEVGVPTITGLVLHCGFESRQSFYSYEKIDEFSYTIKRARLMIEKVYEEHLHFGTPTGAIFALKNFSWKDKQEIIQQEVSEDLEELSDEELEEKIEKTINDYLESRFKIRLADVVAYKKVVEKQNQPA